MSLRCRKAGESGLSKPEEIDADQAKLQQRRRRWRLAFAVICLKRYLVSLSNRAPGRNKPIIRSLSYVAIDIRNHNPDEDHTNNLYLSCKNFVLRVRSSISNILKPPTSPPPNPEVQAKPVRVENYLEWQNTIMAFCFSSALDIAFQYAQNHSQFPLFFHMLSFAILFIFALLFIAKFISLRFPFTSQVLEKVVVFMAITTFFYIISIPFPPVLKGATWIVYTFSMLTVAILNII